LVAVAVVGLLTVAGCGGSSDPNQSVADRLVSHQLVDLNQLCGQAMVDGHKRAQQRVIHDIYSGAGRSYAASHVFTGGATPNAVAGDLLARCQPDGSWK
jgi:hypothetical protein